MEVNATAVLDVPYAIPTPRVETCRFHLSLVLGSIGSGKETLIFSLFSSPGDSVNAIIKVAQCELWWPHTHALSYRLGVRVRQSGGRVKKGLNIYNKCTYLGVLIGSRLEHVELWYYEHHGSEGITAPPRPTSSTAGSKAILFHACIRIRACGLVHPTTCDASAKYCTYQSPLLPYGMVPHEWSHPISQYDPYSIRFCRTE